MIVKFLKKQKNFLINYFEKKIWYQFEFIYYNSLNPILKKTLKIPFGKFLYYSDFSKFPRYVGKILYLNKLDRPKKRIYIYYQISKHFDLDYHLFLKIEETIRNYSIENLNEFAFQFYEFLEKISKKHW
jgi:hypothetical protein